MNDMSSSVSRLGQFICQWLLSSAQCLYTFWSRLGSCLGMTIENELWFDRNCAGGNHSTEVGREDSEDLPSSSSFADELAIADPPCNRGAS